MNRSNAWRSTITLWLFWVMPACTTPMSVGPLLDVADRALRDESAYLEHDLEQQRNGLAHVRQSLTVAFDRDLEQANNLDAQWVREAVRVYTEARETLVRQEATVAEQYRIRADNLAVGREAIARARAVLQMRDELLTDPVDLAVERIAEQQ